MQQGSSGTSAATYKLMEPYYFELFKKPLRLLGLITPILKLTYSTLILNTLAI